MEEVKKPKYKVVMLQPTEELPEVIKEDGIKVGDSVIVRRGATTYEGRRIPNFVYRRLHQVSEVDGNKVVITYNGIVAAVVKLSDLTRA